MISGTKANMSSLVNSLNYRHSGRTLSTLPYNLVKNVKITIPEDIGKWGHMVYSLKKKYLRNNAVAFNEFSKSNVGQAEFKAFSFFIQLIYKIQDKSNGVNFACFLEWVKTNDTTSNDHCGIRVHVFYNGTTKGDELNIMNEMFLQNKTKVEGRKSINNRMDHDVWKDITSRFEYARQVADVYTGTFEASSEIDKGKTTDTSHKSHPLYAFRLESDGFIIDNACPLQKSPNNYRDNLGNYIFPDESRIYRMMPTDLMPDRFFYKYLPDYFFTRIKFPDAIVSNETEDGDDGTPGTFDLTIEPRLERDRYENYLNDTCLRWNEDTWTFSGDDKDEVIQTIKENFLVYEHKQNETIIPDAAGTRKWLLCQERTHDLRIHGETNNSDATPIISPLIGTLLVNKHSLSDIDVLKIRAEYKLGYSKNRRQFQEEMVQEFCERVWDDEEADVSDPALKIILWKQHTRNARQMNFQFEKLDVNMSVFANRAIRIMDFYDRRLFVSAAHKTLFLLQHSKYDAYRQETNLHFNQIYTGEGATSKSFLFEKMAEQSILGTVEELTYQTKRADAIDGDMIDTILVFNEAPPGLFMTNKNSDGEAEAAFKEKLTSQVVRCKEFYRDENTGERKNRIAKSQSIGVVMGATNDNPSDCQEAMATRFFWGQFEKGSAGRSIQECMRGERDMKSDENSMMTKDLGIAYAKEEQMRIWLVFKFMFMKILHKPTLKAADIVYDRLSNHLKRNYKVNIPPRTKERYEILCTVFTIVNALDIVFNIKGGLHSGTPDILDPNDPEKIITKGIPNDFHPKQLLDIEPYLYCTEEMAVFAFTHIQEEFVNPNEFKVLQSLWSIHKTNLKYLEEKQQLDDGTTVKTYNHSYCHMNRFRRLLIEIANNIPVSSGRMSQHNIEALMNDLKDRTISGHTYAKHDEVNSKTYEDNLPQPTKEKAKKQFAVIVNMEGTYVHMDLFNNIRKGLYVNKVRESIKSLKHRFSYHYRNHMMGTNIRDDRSIVQYPNLFDTIELKREDSPNIITMSNPLYMNRLARVNDGQVEDQLSEKQRYRTIAIKNDLTIAGAMTHANVLGMDTREFCLSYTEKMMDFQEVSNSYNYPQAYINMYKEIRESTGEHHDEFETADSIFEPACKRVRRE